MTLSRNELPLLTKWEAERALAVAEAEAYERQRAIAEIRLLMRRYGLNLEDIGTVPGAEDRPHSSEHAALADRG